MRRLFVGLVALLAFQIASAQGIEFFHGTWEEALTKAQEENKMVFVDAYTTWCGPCRRMNANVFPLQEVGVFYNENFVNIKLDMEKEEGRKFGRTYPVSAYPTFFWIDPLGQVVMTTKGGRQAKDFIALGEHAVRKYDGSAKYKKLYDEGQRDYETVYNYIIQLNKVGKSSLRVANDYLKTQDDITTPENLRLVLAAASQVDSKVFDMMVENMDAIVALEGQEAVDDAIRSACATTVERGIKYESPELVEDAVAMMKKYLSGEANKFEVTSHMDYALGMQDEESYLENANVLVKKISTKDAAELNSVAMEIIDHFPNSDKCIKLGLKASKKACELDPQDKHMIVFATMTYLTGDQNGAIAIIDEAIERARYEERPTKRLDLVRRQMSVKS